MGCALHFLFFSWTLPVSGSVIYLTVLGSLHLKFLLVANSGHFIQDLVVKQQEQEFWGSDDWGSKLLYYDNHIT